MEAWQQGAQEVNEQRDNPEHKPRIGEGWETGEAALEARMRLCLKLRQGQAPETPPPFPRTPECRTEEIRQGYASRRKTGAPLTDSLRSEKRP